MEAFTAEHPLGLITRWSEGACPMQELPEPT